jgi:S-adenosylmethionine-diacylglycerol 3-amino-3-carboxypropyl transferase
MSATLQRPLFSYATEDFAVLEAGFPTPLRERVLCICSGGDTMLNLLAIGARHVTVVDNSFPQLALARVKLMGLRRLSQEQFHALLGLPSAATPIAAFAAIRDSLPDSDQRYWKTTGFLRNGALWCGSLARYFTLARRLLKIVVGAERLNRLVVIRDELKLDEFVKELFSLWRFRLLLRILLQPYILNCFYPQKGWTTLDESLSPQSFCLTKLKALLRKNCLSDNPVVYPYLNGSFPEKLWPPYFRIGEAGHSLEAEVEFWEGDLRDAVTVFNTHSFTGFALCNVIDWLRIDEMETLMDRLRCIAAPNAMILMYSRHLAVKDGEALGGKSWRLNLELSNCLTDADRTGYHSAVFVFAAQ